MGRHQSPGTGDGRGRKKGGKHVTYLDALTSGETSWIPPVYEGPNYSYNSGSQFARDFHMMPFIPGNAEYEKFRARVEQEFEISKIVPQDPHDAAYTFFHLLGIDPTPDAVAQLADAFLPALRIMCERGYDPEGTSWKEGGWRGLVWEILKRARRIRWHSWQHSNHDTNDAYDIINFAGFYIRMGTQGEPWGEDGEPDRPEL